MRPTATAWHQAFWTAGAAALLLAAGLASAHPKGYQPDTLPFWPSDKPIVLSDRCPTR
jgi:hypothetical protein